MNLSIESVEVGGDSEEEEGKNEKKPCTREEDIERSDGYVKSQGGKKYEDSDCKMVGSELTPSTKIRNRALCRHFQHGFCKMGRDCNFAHTFDELLAAIPPSTTIRPAPRRGSVEVINYRLCRHFSRTGACRMGHDCRFAHGAKELLSWQNQQEAELSKRTNFFLYD